MTSKKSPRVMWLINHVSARKFEVQMLKSIGIKQIYLPKSFPAGPDFRSAGIDFSEDQFLDIPKPELDVLNAEDWYSGASPEAWLIANKYFDIIFFILQYSDMLINAARYFNGAMLYRAYGLDKTMNYGTLTRDLDVIIKKIGTRFYFAEAYPHLADSEPEYLKRQRIYLPLGLANSITIKNWEGKARQIFFVCPDIGHNPYYKKIYEDFRKNFGQINHVIAGSQPIYVNDPNVLGYVTNEQHEYNMAQSRVMFYHSTEPRHIHYHPFEAIRAGMPLVFMAGGMLDRLGGANLPGRCKTVSEARLKIERILADDWGLIEEIRIKQTVLLDPMRPENCAPGWRVGMEHITSELMRWRSEQALRPASIKHKRIAVILPISYRGGTLRGALALAIALHIGSRDCAEDADVVFIYPDDPVSYTDEELADLPGTISRRPFIWKMLSAAEARCAMRYAGYQNWEPGAERYMVPDDSIQKLQDCDIWLIVSDRLYCPILPLKPVVLMIYDYLQRYDDILSLSEDALFISAARLAERVLVTTEFTRQDVLQYAGLDAKKVSKVPMLMPNFPVKPIVLKGKKKQCPYFIWTTNASPHKNHENAALALQIYYEELEGQWNCKITGIDTCGLLKGEQRHLKAMAKTFRKSKTLGKRVKWMGELSNQQYRHLLSQASFLWHAGRIDNGSFSVIEAAYYGVPSLSSDYPAMREIDSQFSLNLSWMNPSSPKHMAEQLKIMELESVDRRNNLPSATELAAQSIAAHAETYWRELRRCL